MRKDRIIYLLEGYRKQELSDEELLELHSLVNTGDLSVQEAFIELLQREAAHPHEISLDEIRSAAGRIMAIDEPTLNDIEIPNATHRVHFLKTAWFRYAAAVILLFGIGTYLWLHSQRKPSTVATVKPVATKNDIAPGKDGAILTLSDGSRVVLDSMGNGIVANQNGTQVILKDGQLTYDLSDGPAGNMVYNTMSTPKGRQFKITLPDGTRAWLNSASSIRYPTVFSGNQRMVHITGEVYFEVAKNRNMPFRVNVDNKAEIQVLGTSFNINAYENEAVIKTSLLEGSVQVSAYRQLQMLKPGQQAQITGNEKIKVINGADMEKAIAWKKGYFNFNDADLYEVVRQLERWYDIEVEYAKPMQPIEFDGELPRNLSLAQVLEVLGEMRIKFRIEQGRKLIIEP